MILWATGSVAGHWTGLLKQHAKLKSGFASIRPLLPILASFLHHYYLFDRNNGPIITVIMDSLLPIITRSIMGNNGFYYYLLLTSPICRSGTWAEIIVIVEPQSSLTARSVASFIPDF